MPIGHEMVRCLGAIGRNDGATLKATAESLGVQAVVGDFERKMETRSMAAASVVLDIIARRGLGKVKHLDTNHLWTQEVAATKRAKFAKVSWSTDPADMMTKEPSQADISKHIELIGANHVEGHAEWGVPRRN